VSAPGRQLLAWVGLKSIPHSSATLAILTFLPRLLERLVLVCVFVALIS
jgi:hypothetical protein